MVCNDVLKSESESCKIVSCNSCEYIKPLRHELQEKEEHIRSLIKANIDAQEAERERICLEVHDGVTQTMTSAFQHLQALENTQLCKMPEAKHLVARAVTLVKQAIQESRDVINSLTPATLGDLGLVATLRQEIKQLEKETECKAEFEARWPRLEKNMEIALYRILHEAVTNVRKHARPLKMRLELSCSENRLIAKVKDWGVGFDLAQLEGATSRHGTGMFSMRKRAELLGGIFEVHSTPYLGTEIKVEVPWAERMKE